MSDKYKIGVDMDDTIENLLVAWVAWLNKQYNLTVDAGEFKTWGMKDHYPQLTPEQIYEPLTRKDFWLTVTPKGDAIFYLDKLIKEGYDIYICTASHYGTVTAKMQAIVERYFPFIDWKHIIVIEDKSMLNFDLLIDDGLHNLMKGNYKKILLNAQYTQNINVEQYGICRCYNWHQIYKKVHEYFPEPS